MDKKIRIYSELCPDRKTYFDMLSMDEITAILRKMSLRPRSSKWKAFLSPSDAASILHTKGALSAVAQSLFSGLTFDLYRDESIDLWVNDVDPDSRNRVFKELLDVLGPNLKRLVLKRTTSPKLAVYTSIAACSNLRALSVHEEPFDLVSVLASLSGQLRVFEIRSWYLADDRIRAISEHCVGLTKLSLRCCLVEYSLKGLWEAVGPKLEELHIGELCIEKPGRSFSWMHAFTRDQCKNDIAVHCKMLTHLGIENYSCRERSVYDIAALGPRLEVLQMEGVYGCLLPEELEKVKVACPRVRFDAHVVRDVAKTIAALGDRLRLLTVSASACMSSKRKIRKAAMLCSEIEEACLSYEHLSLAEFLSLIFPCPKPKLRKVRVHFGKYCRVLHSTVLDGLSNISGKIESISMHGGSLDESAFQKFCSINTALKHIYVNVENDEKCSMNKLLSFIKDISQCLYLKEVVIECAGLDTRSDRMAEASLQLRKRDVDITVGGIQYN